jgi:very-short-patch-repair endonuclease
MLWEQMRHTLPTWKPLPERQYKYLHDRKFKADFAWPKNMAGYPPEMKPLAIEVQGMVHRVKKQFESDAVKHNTLTEAGWTIYYVTGKMIRSGDAIKLVERILA